MGYWDCIPSGWHHSKKPLTRWQIKKLEQAYAKASSITESVRTLEQKEQAQGKDQIENELKLLF